MRLLSQRRWWQRDALACRGALDLIKRRWVFQHRGIPEFFVEVRGAHNPAHHFRVSRFWYVADENDFARGERFARLDGERVF